ncbi:MULTISPECIES: DUF4843 domain-containing protein [Niastella]|uniref:DUF4843 domain-containing protein n=1 Tax=Niastella soli TaxID=2821487 RepID=A0ABS3YYH3_9BACT|nr:DUF4843 domain-containing protein [Niastella soli]MBO9202969.1 DUF4843 domain-containing protein [Niastella soli]
MKNITILLLAVVVAMTSCHKETTFTYKAAPGIFFNLEVVHASDSILYTFAYHPELTQDTAWVPVQISGDRDSVNDRKFVMEVVNDSTTTAVANKHYEPLKSEYIMKAGKGVALVPVILYNTDTNMSKRPFAVTLRLKQTPDFSTALDKPIITTRVVVSSRLEKPNWWDMWIKSSYSQVKHQLFRLAATTDELTLDGSMAPLYLFYVDQLKALMASPQTWKKNHPDKGYNLDLRPDGNYDFYPVANPTKIIPYVKDSQTGQYFFIDETGSKVI